MTKDISARRVLLVEDELIVAMALGAALADAGCVVVGPIGRIDQALEAATGEQVDIALLDVNLRGSEVFPVADVLSGRGIPFAFLTGYGRESLPPRFATARVLLKPILDTAMLATVEELLVEAGGRGPGNVVA